MLILARKLKSIFLHFICNSISTFCDFFSNKPMASTNSWAGRFYLRARATLMPTCAEFSPFCGFFGAMVQIQWVYYCKSTVDGNQQKCLIWIPNTLARKFKYMFLWITYETILRVFNTLCRKAPTALIYQLLSKSFITLEDGWVQ